MTVSRRFGLGSIAVLGLLLGITACGAAAAPTATAPAPPTAARAATVAPAVSTPAGPSGAVTGVTIKLAQIQGFGLFLTDDAGRTLYAFDNDKKDTSTCIGNCLQNWPPFVVTGMPVAGDRINATLISTFARGDGGMQAEYDGHPLYYYSGDKAPGDIKGHGVGNVWHVLSPRGSPMTNAAPSPTKAP
jgi:predicted lipoprotein with Yx(FWY)xxD motif